MDIMDYVIAFHKDAERQGPGSYQATKRALQYLPTLHSDSKILDIGAGTGAQTMVLAEHTEAKIVAIDMLQEFLNQLQEKINLNNLNERIITQQDLMDNINVENKAFDVIWSEGAIYNIGFKKGLLEWKKFLKDTGYMVISEISWLTEERPKEIEDYWLEAYPEIDTIDAKLAVIEEVGYENVVHFILSEREWKEYYTPILSRTNAFLKEYNYTKEAEDFIKMALDEIKVYEKFKDYYSYVFYIIKVNN